MTKTYIDELAEEIATLREENKRLKEENRALAMGSFPMMLEAAKKIDKLEELLKECRDVMNVAGYFFSKVEDVDKAKNLLTKIDEVLK